MYLEKPLPATTKNNYDLICVKNDEALGLITLYMEADLVHHTGNKSAKQVLGFLPHPIWHSTQIIKLEIELSNLKIADFAIVEEYISRFKNLKVNILTSCGKGRNEPLIYQYCS
jgi:hypothetical protein